MNTITSADGTNIEFSRSGSGPALILVYGNGDIHQFWEEANVRARLAEFFTVYVIERRGRGKSGDHQLYKLEKEAEDIVALSDSIGEPVILLGHSGGAVYSLEASLRSGNLNKLILYEPPIQTGDYDLVSDKVLTELQTLLEQNENEKVLLHFLKVIAGLPQQEIDELRSAPVWQDMVNAARVLPRELQALRNYVFDHDRFENMNTPTLLMTGSDSPALYKDSIAELNSTLPNSRITTFDGQRHMAMFTATGQFIDRILEFAHEKHPLKKSS